jgi:hypothetical protein
MAVAISDVQREIDETKGRIRGLERAVVDLRQGESSRSSDLTLQQVLTLTREIFPGEVRVYEAEDPEIPGDRYHVFEVTADGPVDQVMTRDEQWHRRLCQLPDRIPGRYRLSIVME